MSLRAVSCYSTSWLVDVYFPDGNSALARRQGSRSSTACASSDSTGPRTLSNRASVEISLGSQTQKERTGRVVRGGKVIGRRSPYLGQNCLVSEQNRLIRESCCFFRGIMHLAPHPATTAPYPETISPYLGTVSIIPYPGDHCLLRSRRCWRRASEVCGGTVKRSGSALVILAGDVIWSMRA